MTTPDRPEYTQGVLDMLVDLFRVANDNAREYGHQYREQCDRLRAQLVRSGAPDVDATYSQMKPKDEGIATAMSRWTWWTNEAARVGREIRTETHIWSMGVPPPDPWYLDTLRETLTAARRANETLHAERHQRDRRAYAMAHPTIPMPTVTNGRPTRQENAR